jgi:hypothetical protein
MLIHIGIEVRRDNRRYEAVVDIEGPIRLIPFLGFVRVIDESGRERTIQQLFLAQQSIL